LTDNVETSTLYVSTQSAPVDLHTSLNRPHAVCHYITGAGPVCRGGGLDPLKICKIGQSMFCTCSWPIALDTLGPVNESAVQFLNDLGHKIASVSADDKEGHYFSSSDSLALCKDSAPS